MANIDMTLPALLRHRAETIGDELAYTFVDGEILGTGHPESLTWSQLYRRVLALAGELRRTAATGDRVAIVAPQTLDYVVAFYASLQAGLIAVPLSAPMSGVHDQRVESTLADSAPSILLTTSDAVAEVNKYANAQGGRPAPTVLEVDLIDSASTRQLDTADYSRPGPAYLQYTSGSTRTPAGVVVTHRNLVSNVEQIISDYFAEYGGVPPAEASVVSWLPFFHDLGLIMGICSPLVGGAAQRWPARWRSWPSRRAGCR